MFAIFMLTFNLLGSWILPDHPNVTSAPPADWVKEVKAAEAPRHPSQIGAQFLLIDKQANVETDEIYFHYVRKVLEGGLEDNSQVQVEFDPAFEDLILHHVTIIRDGQEVESGFPERAKLLQREEDLTNNLYHGHLNVHFLLYDIRKDDLIDVAYTLKGANPTLEGHFYHFFDCSYPCQVDKLHFSCVRDKQRECYFKVHNADLVPEQQDISDTLVATSISVAPSWIDQNEEAPSWYLSSPWIQVSSFASWDQVSAWGEEVFSYQTHTSSKEIEDLLGVWSITSQTDEELALKALTFVQEQIRYFGSSEGVYSVRPYSPSQTLARRYGDCKDKTLLLKSFMDSIGIESTPCLVHTDFQQTIADFHPTPGAFNHAVLRVNLDGQTYFLDPTDKYQRGSLKERSQDVYGCYLPLDTTGLQVIEPKRNSSSIDVTHHFALDNADENTLTMYAHYQGEEANFYRALLAYYGEENVMENIRQQVATFYGDADLQNYHIEDDEKDNAVLVVYTFGLNSLVTLNEEYQVGSFNFTPLSLIGNLPEQVDPNRNAPVAIRHPTNIHETIRISSHRSIADEEETQEINHPAFRFHYAKMFDGDDLVLSYAYETKSDHIKPEDVKQFHLDLDEIENLAYQAYYFPFNSTEGDHAKVIVGLIAISFYLLILILVSYQMWKRLCDKDRSPSVDLSSPEAKVDKKNKMYRWRKAFILFYGIQLSFLLFPLSKLGLEGIIAFAIIALVICSWAFLLYKRAKKGGTVVLGIHCYLLAFTVPNPFGIYFLVRSVQLFRYNRTLKKDKLKPQTA